MSQVIQLSKNVSSPYVLDTIVRLNWFQNKYATRKALLRTQQLFSDFKIKNLNSVFLNLYFDLQQAHQIRDHVRMIRHLSLPLYRQWSAKPEDFKFHEQILKINLKSARILQQENEIWAQLRVSVCHPNPNTLKLLSGASFIQKEHLIERKQNLVRATDYWRLREFQN